MKSALLALVTDENILLIKPPGAAKSMVAHRISEAVATTGRRSYFEYLLTRFSTPEELFGPLSISELKKSDFSVI